MSTFRCVIIIATKPRTDRMKRSETVKTTTNFCTYTNKQQRRPLWVVDWDNIHRQNYMLCLWHMHIHTHIHERYSILACWAGICYQHVPIYLFANAFIKIVLITGATATWAAHSTQYIHACPFHCNLNLNLCIIDNTSSSTIASRNIRYGQFSRWFRVD